MNTQELKSKIMKFDRTQENLAIAMGISLSRLNAKINNNQGADFSQGEIKFIKERYELTNEEVVDIFFNKEVSGIDTIGA